MGDTIRWYRDGPLVTYERLESIVRVQGIAVVRQYGREVEASITPVLRSKGDKELAANIMGEASRGM